jgi:hypothetical protein
MNAMKPKKWYQWCLLYPTLLIAIIGMVPKAINLVDSYKYDIPYADVAEAGYQNKLWERNFDCIREDMEVYLATTKLGDIIKVAACEGTGDVIVEIDFKDGNEVAKWIAFDTFCDMCGDTATFLSPSLANAMEAYAIEQKVEVTVICQRWLRNGRLFRRVSVNGICYDEVINTWTGEIESRLQVGCAPCFK